MVHTLSRALAHDGGMLVLYLAVNAVLYVAFAIWCTLAPRTTANWLGLATTGAGGESEYLAVYGGLQAGLGVGYSLSLWLPETRPTALLWSVAVYGGLVAWRSLAACRLGFRALGNARFTLGLEFLLLLAAVLLLWGRGS
jgi:hypothetical protein